MKLLRQLKPLAELTFPREAKYKPHETVDCRGAKFPSIPAITFIHLLEDLATQPKRQRFALLEKHNELFGAYPEPGTKLEVVRARCVYRLQFEGHRLTQTKPSDKFLHNYRAVMKFTQEPFDGCTRDVAIPAKLLALIGGEVSMTAVKATATNQRKVVRLEKKAAKAAKPEKAKKETAKSMRPKVLGKYSVTGMISYMAKELDASVEQIDAALKKLGVQATLMTIQSYRASGIRGKGVPKIESEDVKKIKAATPAAKAEKAAPKKLVKLPPKKK